MARRKPLPVEPVELLIESLAHDGRGVGRYQGKTMFVSGALPGETVTAKVVQRRRRFDIALVQQVIEASPDRVEPACRHFSQCGGCSLQNMAPQAQLRHKQSMLAENLKRIGKVEPLRWIEPLQADVWAYRSKARLGVRYVKKKERVLVGFREKGSSFITDTQYCAILVNAIGPHLEYLSERLSSFDMRDEIPQIEVAAGDSRLSLIFRVLCKPGDADLARFRQLGNELDCDVLLQPSGPESVYPVNTTDTELSYVLPQWDLELRFQPQDFTQVNTALNRGMVAQALFYLQPERNDTVLDLFCGLGNFSLPIARMASHVTGVEGDLNMVKRAEENARSNSISNTAFFCADLFQPLLTQPWSQVHFDKVMLDPPRSGAEEVSKWLLTKRPQVIVYVSCNPSTLARDAHLLVENGDYVLREAGIMDMFPHTAHTEAMAVFCLRT